MSADLIGRTVGGKFRLRRVVGAGASGAVYEADQVALGRTVAVKVLRAELTAEPRLQERFHAEAQLASRLNHPNTVSIIDYGSTPDGLLYMVMEYLRGQTLTQILQTEHPIAIERIIDYAVQILDGLEEAHDAGVVHADLKADNIMVERRRGADQVKVVDFGIAQLVGGKDFGGSDETVNRTISGTPEYMAPEVITGTKPAYTADLYAVGVILYELWTGRTPYAGGGVMEILTSHLRDEPPPPSQFRSGIPKALEQGILRALSKKPADRFSSAAEFRDFLRLASATAEKAPQILCTGCGVKIDASFRFCPECGHSTPIPGASSPKPVSISFRSPGAGKAEPRGKGKRAAAPRARNKTDGYFDEPTSVGRSTTEPDVSATSDTHSAMDSVAPPLASVAPPLDLDDAATEEELLELQPTLEEEGAPLLDLQEPPVDGRAGTAAFDPSEFEPIATTSDQEAPRVGVLPLPMVGRLDESQALFRFLTGSSRDNFLQVVGSPGSGKSRLILREAERAAEVGAMVLLADPDPSGLKASLYPIRSMLIGVLGLADGGSAESIANAVDALGLSDRDLPGLLDLFGFPTELAELEEPVRRRELLASTLRALAVPAQVQQAVLIFHNVDHYDQPSQDLLRLLAERSNHEGLRVVVSNGESYSNVWPERVAKMTIGPLGDGAVDELAAHLSSRGSSAMPTREDLVDRCHARPEHIYQMVRYVLEGGVAVAAPESLVDLIAARVDLLPYEAQLLVQVAAVFGSEVPVQDLEVTAAEHLETGELADALAVAVARGFLEVEGEMVRFPQYLVREVVYDSTPADVRRVLHDLAYAVLVDADAPDLILGHHACMAEQPHIAAVLLECAGDSAVYQLDDSGAGELYHRSLDCARQLLMSEPSEQNEARYVAVSVKLAESLRSAGNLILARGVLAEARRYAQEAPALTAAIDRAEGGLLALEGWMEPAEECMRRGIGIAIQSGQARLLAELYLDLASLLFRSGRTDEAIGELREGIDMLTFGEGPVGTGGPENLWALVLRIAKLEAGRGRLQEAARMGEASLKRAEANASAVGQARVRGFLAGVYRDLGDATREKVHRERALRDLRNLGDRRGTAEMLLAAAKPTLDIGRSSPDLIGEAEALVGELGESLDELG